LPTFNEKLFTIDCTNNLLTSLPNFNKNLDSVNCSNNKITCLPTLNEYLETLYCSNNHLRFLPTFNENLRVFNCENNDITYFPSLNIKLEYLSFSNNPIYSTLYNNYFNVIKINIETLIRFRHLYYYLKFKNRFKKWLWERVREPIIIQKYHPSYLIENINENIILDDFLENW
jgi:hypothetical protein